jgi:hypothetical protein
MEGTVIATDPGLVRVGAEVKRIDLPQGVKVGDVVIVVGRVVRRKETCAMSVKETK